LVSVRVRGLFKLPVRGIEPIRDKFRFELAPELRNELPFNRLNQRLAERISQPEQPNDLKQ
jgi:hypothetical protein